MNEHASISVKPHLGAVDWDRAEIDLDTRGYTLIPRVLDKSTCATLARSYDDAAAFRARIVMQRHGFGQGEYQYFAYPLPDIVAALREAAYPPLASIANRWKQHLKEDNPYPPTLRAYTALCHARDQTRPTPLLLKYGPGDFNRLHQDLYGDLYFPMQMVVLLSAPERDFTGGEFVLTELKPRAQSRVEVVPLGRGDACVFAVNHRPVQGQKGYYRAGMRHGVSQVRSGQRFTLGIIFHDAK
jgi:hypothetical protein